MSTVELKQRLIDKIQTTEDVHLLEELSVLLDIDEVELEPYHLNDEQIEAIRIAREQFAKGEFYTNEEANAEIEKWLNK